MEDLYYKPQVQPTNQVYGEAINVYKSHGETLKQIAFFSSGTFECFSNSAVVVTLDCDKNNKSLVNNMQEAVRETNTLFFNVNFSGSKECVGNYLCKIDNVTLETNTISLQNGKAENTEVLVLSGSNYYCRKIENKKG